MESGGKRKRQRGSERIQVQFVIGLDRGSHHAKGDALPEGGTRGGQPDGKL